MDAGGPNLDGGGSQLDGGAQNKWVDLARNLIEEALTWVNGLPIQLMVGWGSKGIKVAPKLDGRVPSW